MGGYIDITTSVYAGLSDSSEKLFPNNKQEPEIREISKGHFVKCPLLTLINIFSYSLPGYIEFYYVRESLSV
jgi:hypothetical protein